MTASEDCNMIATMLLNMLAVPAVLLMVGLILYGLSTDPTNREILYQCWWLIGFTSIVILMSGALMAIGSLIDSPDT